MKLISFKCTLLWSPESDYFNLSGEWKGKNLPTFSTTEEFCQIVLQNHSGVITESEMVTLSTLLSHILLQET